MPMHQDPLLVSAVGGKFTVEYVTNCSSVATGVSGDAIARSVINTLRLRQNRCHFPDDIFKRVLLNENVWILIKISLKFVPNGRINNIPALVQIMAWRCPCDKPLFEPIMFSIMIYIYASLGLNELKMLVKADTNFTGKPVKLFIFMLKLQTTKPSIELLVAAKIVQIIVAHQTCGSTSHIEIQILAHIITHWVLVKTADILQITYSTVCPRTKMFVFWFNVRWSLFGGVQLKIYQHWFR